MPATLHSCPLSLPLHPVCIKGGLEIMQMQPVLAKVFYQYTVKQATGKAASNSTFPKRRFHAIRRTHRSLDMFAQFFLTCIICFPNPVLLASIALHHDSTKDYLPVGSQFKKLNVYLF